MDSLSGRLQIKRVNSPSITVHMRITIGILNTPLIFFPYLGVLENS